MPDYLTSVAVERFYRAALIGLRFLDSAQARPTRFGRDADAHWGDFQGHLQLSDRIDILCRDAAVKWGGGVLRRARLRMGGVTG